MSLNKDFISKVIIPDKDSPSLSSNQHIPDNTEAKFLYYKRPIRNTMPYKDIGLRDVVSAIKGERAKKVTQHLRSIKDADEARAYKSTHFDYVTFSGTFSKRNRDGLIVYSGYMVLDIDHVDVAYVIKKLLNQKDVGIVMLFISPSGDGVKLVVLSTTVEEHEQVFKMYQRYFKDKFDIEIDESGKDIARACFIPHDANVYFNEDCEFRKLEEYWDNPTPEESKQESTTPSYTTTQTRAVQYDEELSPFDDYSARGDVQSLLETHGWRVDKSNSNSKNIRLTRPGKNGGTSADLRRSDNILFVFTSNSVFEAQRGYNPTQVFTLLNYGSLSTDAYNKAALKLQDMGYGEASTPSHLTTLASDKTQKSTVCNFYTSSFTMSASQLAKYYKHIGFIRISEEGNDTITIIKNDNKILNPFNHKTDTIAFLKQNIHHPEKREHLENLLVSNKNLIQNSWELMVPEPYNLHKDTKDAIYLPFKNGVCKITASGIEMIDYKSKEIKFFVGTESQKHHFEMVDITKRGIGDFEKFLIYAIIGRETDELTEIERNDVIAFYSMIGYLISNYKNSAYSPAVIFTDQDADDEARKGARGKSLLTEAIRKVRGAKFRDGAKFETGYRHVYADLERYHNVYILDDVLRNFNFNALYTDITGDIRLEGKGTNAVTIPFEDAPKFVITTNYAVRHDKDADSTNRRFIEYKFSYFWNLDNTPEKHFGCRFFDDWDDKEWQLFYEFLIVCSMQFLTTGLKRIGYSKVDDNYRAYFSNSVVEGEFERVYAEMKGKESFSVMEFLEVHNESLMFKYKSLFNHINTKRYVDAYIEKHDEEVEYSKTDKRWYFQYNPLADNEAEEDDINSVFPFCND